MKTEQLKAFWEKLVGRAGEVSLEARIFHAVSVLSIFVLGFTVVFDYMIGIRHLALFMFVVFILDVVLYYLSRFRKMLNVSIILFSLISNILFVINFYYNSGLNGPTLLIFILMFFFTIAIAPKNYYVLLMVFNILTVVALLAGAYYFPSLIIDTYPNNFARYVDFSYTYVIIVFLIFMITRAIRNSYIQEKKLAEQRAHDLQQSNDTKNKLFSILAHDLRSPLSSIQNFLEILSEYKLEESEKQTIQKALLTETQNTQQMLSNLLSWSKGQMDGVQAKSIPVYLFDALKVTFKILQTSAAEKMISLKNEIEPNACVIADPDMLELVIRNLVNNAIKFTSAGGEIIVRSTLNEGNCHITIQDNGTGIPYEQQGDIFSLRARSTFGTKNEKGVGLGLVLCKEFTELQNGTITFRSQPGVGTSFCIILKSCSNSAEKQKRYSGKQVV